MVQRLTAEVISNKDINSSTFLLELKPEKKFEFKPGQYVILQITIDDQPVRRSYSIASKKEDENIQLLIRRVSDGKVSPTLHKLKEGEQVILIGPAGMFVRRESKRTELYIAAGTGIAPLRSMIHDSKNKKILIEGARTKEGVLFREEFENMQNERFKFYYCTSREDNELKGYVQDNINKTIKGTEYECYICGLKDMVEQTVKKLEDLGIPRKQIHFERYN
jgi:NAD(P)H-flavin reductase